MLDDAKDRVREELGPDFDEEEWRKLDPRQYDPRRIIRDALLEPPEPRRRDAEPDDEPEPVAEPVRRTPPRERKERDRLRRRGHLIPRGPVSPPRARVLRASAAMLRSASSTTRTLGRSTVSRRSEGRDPARSARAARAARARRPSRARPR